MAKIIFFISFFSLSFVALAQKPSFYHNKAYDLNTFNYFFIEESGLPVEKIQSPYLDKYSLNDNQYMGFALYNELSLKNLIGTDDDHGIGVFASHIYTAITFKDGYTGPKEYKPKKLKTEHLIIDLVDGGQHTLVWRGWIDLTKIKAGTDREKLQTGILLLMALYTGSPANPAD